MKMKIYSFAIAIFFTLSVNAQESTLGIDLQKAIDIALAENPSIRIADKDVKLKEIAKSEAWQQLLPTISANGQIQHTLLAAEMKLNGNVFKMGQDNTNTAAVVGTVSLPVFAPAIYRTIKLTKQDILLAKEKARASRLDLVNQVTKAFYGLLLAQESRDALQQSYDVSKKNFELVNNKYKVGTVSEYDKISAEVQMRTMNSSLVSAKNAVTIAELNLKVLMGVTADLKIVADDKLVNHEKDLVYVSETGTDNELNSNNSSLKQLDMNYELLRRTKKLQYANFMPSVSFQLSAQYQSLYNPNWKLWDYKWAPSSNFIINLAIPLFTASNFTKLKTTKVQMSQLLDTKENTRRRLAESLEAYRENMASAIVATESNKEAVFQAEKALKIAEKRYDVGKGTILELDQSEVAQAQTKLTYYESIYNYLVNKADYEYTLGRKY